MIKLKFPDGQMREFPDGVSGLDVAKDISPSLAKAALAIEIDGELLDLTREIEQGGSLRIITIRDEEGLS